MPRRFEADGKERSATTTAVALIAETILEAALLSVVLFGQIQQKVLQRLLASNLRYRFGLPSIAGHLDAQWLTLAAYFPTPPPGLLAGLARDEIIVRGLDCHGADQYRSGCCGAAMQLVGPLFLKQGQGRGSMSQAALIQLPAELVRQLPLLIRVLFGSFPGLARPPQVLLARIRPPASRHRP